MTNPCWQCEAPLGTTDGCMTCSAKRREALPALNDSGHYVGCPRGPCTCAATDAIPMPKPVHVTVEQVLAILPSLEREPSYPLTVTEALNGAAREAELTTPRRMAAFLSQVAHESGEFRWLVELPHGRKPVPGCRVCAAGRHPHAAGVQYEGREELGNVEPGDGCLFKGRGPMQLTGRTNYRAAGKALGDPLEQQPELAARLDVGMRVAAWYWRTRGCNNAADSGVILDVTKIINGGVNGLAQRSAYYERALRVLESRPEPAT